MKRIVFFLIYLAYSVCTIAQTTSITKISSTDGDLNFPIITTSDSISSRKINDYLQSYILLQAAHKLKGAAIFDKCKYTEKKLSGLDEINYKVRKNTAKVLSLTFDIDYLAAHPNPYTLSFCFNVQNGELIRIGDLLTLQGLNYFGKKIRQKRAIVIDRIIGKPNKSDPDDEEEGRADYESCNTYADSADFIITTKGITFRKTNCLAYIHETDVLDTDLNVTYTYTELQPYLTSFGQQLFTDSVKDIHDMYFASLDKPLMGTINNAYKIVLNLDLYHGQPGGSCNYYYISKGTTIQLEGKIKGKQINLSATDQDGDKGELFNGTIEGSSIKGTWTNLKTKMSYPFEASYQSK